MFLLLASLVTLAAAAPQTPKNPLYAPSLTTVHLRNVAGEQQFGCDNEQLLWYNPSPWTITTVGNQYIISEPMYGYQKEDITVLAHKGALVMRAIHKERILLRKENALPADHSTARENMFLQLASLVTLATAAPHTLPEAHFTYLSFKEFTRDILPDTKNLDNFNIAYDFAPWTIITSDNQYILSMPITGYKKEDIMVLAHRGALVMKTVYKEEDIIKKSDLSMVILPRHVNPAGWWTYHEDVLKVVFPIYGKEKVDAIRDPGASDVTQIVLDSIEGFEKDLLKH